MQPFQIYLAGSPPLLYTMLKLVKNCRYTRPRLFFRMGEGLRICNLKKAHVNLSQDFCPWLLISASPLFVPSAIRVFRKMGDVAMVQSLEGIQVSNTAKATNPSQPLTSSSQDNSANFSGEFWIRCNEALRGIYFLRIREKTLSQISYSRSF